MPFPVLPLKQLKCKLFECKFSKAKLELEQYHTPVSIAVDILHHIQTEYDDICNKTVLDLGCGPGVLLVGCHLLQAGFLVGFEVDPDALSDCVENLEHAGVENCDVALLDVTKINLRADTWWDVADTVIINPPFGTKNNEDIDQAFVQVALAMAKSAVYSLHKTTRRKHFVRKAGEWGVCLKPDAALAFNLERNKDLKLKTKDKKSRHYRGPHHKKESEDVHVDLLRFSFPDGKHKLKEYIQNDVST